MKKKDAQKKVPEKVEIRTKLEQESLEFLESVEQTGQEMNNYYVELTGREPSEELEQEVEQKVDSYLRAASNARKGYQSILDISDELNGRFQDMKKSHKKKLIPAAPTNAAIDLSEKKTGHFAQGMNLYKLLLVCYIGSFVGVVIELIWCLLKNGYLESRSGLVYGPFNLVYGLGAVVLSAALYKYRNHGRWLSFLMGMLVGSVVEYLCSWVQEVAFGSRSWDYSQMPFNINGRICLLYSVFWGFLGVLWIKNLYPRMAELILKIPNRIGRIITWLLLTFFLLDACMSSLAVFRWSERVHGIEATGIVEEFFDERFPDERMERIYANMEFGE